MDSKLWYGRQLADGNERSVSVIEQLNQLDKVLLPIKFSLELFSHNTVSAHAVPSSTENKCISFVAGIPLNCDRCRPIRSITKHKFAVAV